MRTLVLSYFDIKAGPRVFLQVPGILNEEDLKQIYTLLDLHREGFFAHVFKNFRTANFVFEIPNINIRGSREILLISLVVDITQDLNLTLSRELLEDFAEEMNEIVDVYKALHAHSTGYKDAYDKFIEVKELLSTFHKSFKPAMKALKVAELRYQALFKAARDTILIIDRKSGIIIDANDEAERLFRRPRGRIIGLNSIHLNLTCEDENLTDYFLKRVELKDDSTFIAQITNSIGENITVEVSGSEIKIGDQHLAQFILHNITERLYYENQLIESEEKYRLISENANELITVINNKFKYEYMNEQPFIKQLGYSSEDIIGRSVWRFIHPDDLRESVEKFRDEELHKNFEQELRIKHKDGHWVWFGVRGKTLIDENGGIKFLFFSRDISERKKVQQKLVESEEKYRLITENINDVICILNNKFVMEFVNEKALQETVGYNKEEVIGKSILNFVQPEETGEITEILNKGFKKGRGITIGKFKHKDGHWVWLEIKGTTFIDENEDVKALIIGRDVSERVHAEIKIKESEEKYRLITENSNDLIALFNTKFEHTYINERTYMKILGYSNDDMLGKTNLDLIHPDDLEQAVKAEKDGIRTGVGKVELRIRHKKGHYLWFEFQGQKYIDREGKTKGLIVGRDITTRKKAKEELMESEERFRTLFENSPYSIILIDLIGKIIDCNSKTHDLFGYTREDIINKRYIELTDDSSKFAPIARNRLKDLLEGKRNELIEHQMRKKDGTLIWVSSLSSLVKLEGGTYIQISAQDITEKKISEQKLIESEEKYKVISEKYRLISENAKDVIGVLNKKFDIEYVNEQALMNLMGYRSGDVIGKSGLSFVHPDDVNRTLKSLNKGLKEGQDTEEVRFRHRDGHYVWFEGTGKTFIDREGEIRGVVILRDITERKKSEKKLKESEEKYRLITENANDLIVVLNENFEYEFINEEVHQRIMGYSKEDVIGKSSFSLIHPDDLGEATKTLKKGLKIGEGEGEARVRNKKGDFVWLEVKGRTFIDKDGKKKVLLISRDITDRKISEQLLKESEEKYRLISENANDLISVFNEKFEHEYINESTYLKVLGYTKNDIIGTYALNFMHPDDHMRVANVLKKGLKKEEITYEVRVKHKDEHWVWIGARGKFFLNYKGEMKFLLIGRDITDRKGIEQNLRESEEKYRILFNQSPFSMIIFNPAGIIIDCNPTTQKMFEYEKKELIGRHFENVSILAPKDLNIFFKLFKEFMQGKTINPIDLQVYKSDGTLFWSNLQFSLINMRNRTYVKGIFRDISEKKMSDLKLEESEKKYRQAYEVANFYRELFAHDMNNILQNFQYSVELISCFTKDSIKLDELIEVSGVLEREVIRGIKLVSNIRKISTLEEAQIPTESVDALKVLNDTFKFIYKNFREKEINIELKTPKDKLLIIANQLLPDLFETILIHAIKYNVNPVKEIQIKTSEEQKDDVNYLKIEFIDNGMGISDERKDKIFKRAYDGGRGTREMGIGFLLIKQIIDNYNGEIIVENRIKDDYTKGSNFIVLIPAAS